MPFDSIGMFRITKQKCACTLFKCAGDEYKFRIACADATEDWLFYLSEAAHAEADSDNLPGNLMSFE